MRERGKTATAGQCSPTVAYDPDIPMHHQIFLDLCKQIDEGLWVQRDDFPGGKELAERYEVSKITAERALDRLVKHGWIERARGRRPVVLRPPSRTDGDMPGLLKSGYSRSFSYELLANGPEIAPSEACEVFGVPAGTELWTVRRLRKWRGKPHSVTHNVQLVELGSRHKLTQLKSKPMLAILSAEGNVPVRATRQFSVRPVSGLEANSLDLTLGQPALAATFAMFDASDAVLQWVRIQLHPDVRTPLENQDLIAGTGWLSGEHL